MTTVVQDMQTILPSLAPPSGKYAHLTSTPGFPPAHCGWSGTPQHLGHSLDNGDRCSCGVPICPTCLAIEDSWINSGGAWEGA